MPLYTGPLRKLEARAAEPVDYAMPIGDGTVPLNALIGAPLRIRWLGRVLCIHCGRASKKSFNQGYCYPCFRRLARCDTCIVKPELCHYHKGTCREPAWGEANCMREHVVYLANTSGLKVGITRGTQVPTRWLDQGATQALPILRVASRLDSGLVERLIAESVPDKTHWQAMLRGPGEPLDLDEARQRVLARAAEGLRRLEEERGQHALRADSDASVASFTYPVTRYPERIKAINLDKVPEAEGRLLGIKGQYLLLDSGVMNIRKYGGYDIEFSH